MSVTIEAGVLSRAMKSAASVVERANTIPILANVRLEAFGNQLEIVTSNLEIEYRQRVPAIVSGGINTTCDANRLSALAGAVDAGGQINLEMGAPGRLIAKAARSRWQLPVLPVDTFPEMKQLAEGSANAKVEGKVLAAAIARTVWTAGNDSRHQLAGTFAHGVDGKFRFVATDGHKVAQLDTSMEWPDGGQDVIIPTKLARLIERLSSDADQVALSWDDRLLRAQIGDVTVVGKLIDGIFPDYRRVIPAPGGSPILVDPEVLRKAIRRIELVGSERTRAIALDRQAGAVELRLTDAATGEANEHVPADCQPGHSSGFNSGYLAAALEAVGGDTIEIYQSSPSELALIRRAVPDGAICGLMPMRI